MNKITLKDMKFFAFHGVYQEEKEEGQAFFIDVEFFVDMKQKNLMDDLGNAIDHAVIYRLIKRIVEGNVYNLLETLAENIAEEILYYDKIINKVVVRIKKPKVNLGGVISHVEVEILREKNV